ncbi:triggering receptor expressed on myeloid cells 2-like isoform X1 [Ahaetulla prasina]|uniref:triggering receptor expressed on myeloid cells 2-like isoform X1 n=1 Tax=Ahaetulla prasina TaxID=499056 RepID=UPI002648F215|nr:triggering receptor expressed on myeloid cells 2-like isoform X1 [Ahaetulla prasina]
MKKLLYLIFLVYLSEVSTAEIITEISGVEGEPISINCSYSPQTNQWREKSWCKHISEATCQHVVSARRFWLPFLKRRNGTTAIADNIQKGVLMITINPLQKEDAGWYQCMTHFLGTVKTLQKVKVNVLTSIENSNVQETPRILHSISSSSSNAGVNLTFLVAGFLGFKLLVAIIILMVARRKKRTTGNDSRGENQHFHLPMTTGTSEVLRNRELAGSYCHLNYYQKQEEPNRS